MIRHKDLKLLIMTKEQIINVVCEVCGTSIPEIRSKSIARNVVAARHLIAYNICFRHGVYSMSEAAEEIGTMQRVLYERATPRAIQARRRTDAAFAHWYNQIEARLSRKISAGVRA